MSSTLFAAVGDDLRKVRSNIISQLEVLSWSLGPKKSSQAVELSEDVIIIYVVDVIFWQKRCCNRYEQNYSGWLDFEGSRRERVVQIQQPVGSVCPLSDPIGHGKSGA